ncbi:MAG: hypothetical protein C4290_00980 [Chloroflexota bacterium]
MEAEARCGVCGRAPTPGYRFQGGVVRCGRHALTYRPVLLTALLVGSVLTAINQGDHLLRGEVTGGVVLKMGLTYCVPFAVSTSGALGAARVARAGEAVGRGRARRPA